jgi:hypothetical protein
MARSSTPLAGRRIAYLTPPAFQCLLEGGQGKRRISLDDNGLSSGLAAIDDGEEHFVPPVRTVDVARPEFGGHAVTARIEDVERVIANGLEVAIVGGLLLGPVDRALRAVSGSSIGPTRAGSVPY